MGLDSALMQKKMGCCLLLHLRLDSCVHAKFDTYFSRFLLDRPKALNNNRLIVLV